MSDEKIWVGGAFFKRKNFANGGAITSMWSPNVDELCQWLQANKKADGTIAINISGSREPRMDEHGNEKLNASLDTWVKEGQGQQAPAPQPMQQQTGVDPSFAAPQLDAFGQPIHAPSPQGYAQPVAQPQPVAQQTPAPQFDPNTGQRLN